MKTRRVRSERLRSESIRLAASWYVKRLGCMAGSLPGLFGSSERFTLC
jgi:hypothetical protein